MRAITLGLGNYYGEVTAFENEGKFIIQLGDWNGPDTIEISEEFFKAIEKEFG